MTQAPLIVDLLSDALRAYVALKSAPLTTADLVLKAQNNIVEHLFQSVLETAPTHCHFSSGHSIFIELARSHWNLALRFAQHHQEKVWTSSPEQPFPLLAFTSISPMSHVWRLSKKERQTWGELVQQGLKHAMPLKQSDIPTENINTWKLSPPNKQKLLHQAQLVSWLSGSELPDPWLKTLCQEFSQQEGAWVFEDEVHFSESAIKEFMVRSVKTMNPTSPLLMVASGSDRPVRSILEEYVQLLDGQSSCDVLPQVEVLLKKAKSQSMEILPFQNKVEDVKAYEAYFELENQDGKAHSRQKAWEEFLQKLKKVHRLGVNAVLPTGELAWQEAISQNGSLLAQALISTYSSEIDWQGKNKDGDNIWSSVASAVNDGWTPDFSVMRLARKINDIQLPPSWKGVYWDRPRAGEMPFYEKSSNVGLFPFWFGSLSSQRQVAEQYCYAFYEICLGHTLRHSDDGLAKLSQSVLLERMASEIQWVCWMFHDHVGQNPEFKKNIPQWDGFKEKFKLPPCVPRPTSLSIRWMNTIKSNLPLAIPELTQEEHRSIVSVFEKQTLMQSQPKKAKPKLSLPTRRL